jgi:hypothetical protein
MTTETFKQKCGEKHLISNHTTSFPPVGILLICTVPRSNIRASQAIDIRRHNFLSTVEIISIRVTPTNNLRTSQFKVRRYDWRWNVDQAQYNIST